MLGCAWCWNDRQETSICPLLVQREQQRVEPEDLDLEDRTRSRQFSSSLGEEVLATNAAPLELQVHRDDEGGEEEDDDTFPAGDTSSWMYVSKEISAPSAMIATHTACIDRTRQSTSASAWQIDKFRRVLDNAGCDVKALGRDGAKSLEDLFEDVHQEKGSIFVREKDNGKLWRLVRLVRVKVRASILGVDRVLVSRRQYVHEGKVAEKVQTPMRKLVWNVPFEAALDMKADVFLTENCPSVQPWRAAASELLANEFGLSRALQEDQLVERPGEYAFLVEDAVESVGFRGITTKYCVHEVTYHVWQPEHPDCQIIGLPHGQEFATASSGAGDSGGLEEALCAAVSSTRGSSMGTRGSESVSGSQLNMWAWRRDKDVTGDMLRSSARSRRLATMQKQLSAPTSTSSVLEVKKIMTNMSHMSSRSSKEDFFITGRVPVLDGSSKIIDAGVNAWQQRGEDSPSPNKLLVNIFQGIETQWDKALGIARRLLEPAYTLRQFYEDLAVFSEISLYLMEERADDGEASPVPDTSSLTTSGRTLGDEYQRTVGAFFAIYWMMRLHIDGKAGFVNGVDKQWKAVTKTPKDDEKRKTFEAKAQWKYLQKILKDAGLLKVTGGGLFATPTYEVDEQRVAALLALTAFHDIMKMSLMLPTVQAEHAPFHGYEAGTTIGDHDHALSYVLERYPQLLPSFRALDARQRQAVIFSQCSLGFNHGWFVQAEAPPGAMLTSCRATLLGAGGAHKADVAFYFVHWLTDLAGAEATPLFGCEKFVTKFPLAVLNSFLRSFEFVGQVVTRTETEVVESYLKVRWDENVPPLGRSPKGPGAIAKMRLACMAQANSRGAIRAFDDLSKEDRQVLSVEMARTGCAEQSFSAALVPGEVAGQPAGPAFLVYYGPAFLQASPPKELAARLAMLAEVYRTARLLWPCTPGGAASNVSVRIDMLRSVSVKDIVSSDDFWILVRHNDAEAFVEKRVRPAAGAGGWEVLDFPSVITAHV